MNEPVKLEVMKPSRKEVAPVLSLEQRGFVQRIKAYHSGVKKAFCDQMGYAFLAGRALTQLKDSLPHGKFIAAREKYLPDISNGSAGNYMRLHGGIIDQISKFGNLPAGGNGQLLLTLPTKLSKPEQAEVVKAVHDIAEGKTLTEMYRELGLIRKAEVQKYTPPTITEEEKVKADLEHSRCLGEGMIEQIYLWLDDAEQHPEKCPPELRERALAAGVKLNDRIRNLKKSFTPSTATAAQ